MVQHKNYTIKEIAFVEITNRNIAFPTLYTVAVTDSPTFIITFSTVLSIFFL